MCKIEEKIFNRWVGNFCCVMLGLLSLMLVPLPGFAQNGFASWTGTELVLDNGIVKRVVQLPATAGPMNTVLYKPVKEGFRYFIRESDEFSFEIDKKTYSGRQQWTLLGVAGITDLKQGQGAAVRLLSSDKKVEVTVNYLLYPALALVRKNITVKNLSAAQVSLESLDVEKLSLEKYNPNTYSWILSDYGRRRSLGPYEGNKQDALLIVHNPEWQQGIIIGNEAPGVMKRTSVFWEAPEICAGLSHNTALFPFRKWLKTGESFSAPQVFTMLYNQKDPDLVLNTALPDYLRKHMGIRLSELKDKPTFVYNTWRPFKGDINEKLIMELARAAAAAGMKEFVIDDGWQDNVGDWGINKQKFPNGLKPVFDYIKSLGMKPGLWVSVGTASPKSQVYQQHPEWFVHDKNGKPTSLVIDENDKYTACFGTGWYGHIRTVLNRLTMEYGLEYLKLDFSIVTSPYRYAHDESGCYATGHLGHKDHPESLYTNYEFMWQLFDDLHVSKPELFIDCTFETMGGLQLIDYAMLKHAEGNWLSNYYEINEGGDLRVRNMAWWRSPAMSATALVIGNMAMQDTGWEMHIKSLAGALPILLGDPRQLSDTDRKKYAAYSIWLQLMAKKHDIMSYRQDLVGFGEPKEGSWDGFQRINTESYSGGIFGVFRHGAREKARKIYLSYLDTKKRYRVKNAVSGKIVAEGTGDNFLKNGIPVVIDQDYGGELFEVTTF